ncbi:hypothetical protein A2960_01085 [Candidatus Gottesmanbacteria bacterium RIFCSPLOWO2_01_FULL_39_12b]|uniref:Uncharacterized protein n=1 Tax=Candidatus Gottesmanbacteria bacterium RIFCSPLOWO2_01_FULL_39_12b TaxID=1798388 RepID=A0A1F6APX2_9BACT|nr:MAG: hypothetical protein A2960_01085 [Candidatus Gottesmanbacteria bacterium RIFCSPLOWO2_01_FULL_39_12b]
MKKKILLFSIVLIIVSIFFAVWKVGFSSVPQVIEEIPTPTDALPTVSSEIAVDLASKSGNKAVVLKINGISSDINSIEYELIYITGSGLSRGVVGKIALKGEKEIIRDDIVLGTCSSGKCVYDTGVDSVDLTLKFHSASGISVYQKKYSL